MGHSWTQEVRRSHVNSLVSCDVSKALTTYLEGLEATSGNSLRKAIQRLLGLLYPSLKPSKPKKKGEVHRDHRNEEIRQCYEAGERALLLAEEYGLTIQALYKVLRRHWG